MDYKRIIRSQTLRFRILKAFSWVPDSWMIRLQYRIKTGRWPNLEHPQRFTEKLQVYKMKYRNPTIQQCVDKFEVRKYVESKGLGDILNELYGVYNMVDRVELKQLPQQFVIKSCLGSGGQNVLIVKDKDDRKNDIIDKEIKKMRSLKDSYAILGREWAYYGHCQNRIIIEKYLEEEGGLIDYKFFCFNGEPRFLYVITDRIMGKSATLGVYDMDFHKISVYRCDEMREEQSLEIPMNFAEMKNVAKRLSEDFPHVRVDLYNLKGKIYFGELTFYDGSGYFNYDPDEFDFQVGSYFTEYN